ncbi:MAG: hypothetical protein JW709_08145 [Sedimentisphaerales bacterium]|nr:hypothetical protein [Sedimentisphaerales bacterium]
MANLLTIALLGQVLLKPLEVSTTPAGLLWALPISFCIALVYKAIKLDEFRLRLFVREVILLFATIIGFLILVAVIMAIIAHLITL